MRRYPCFGGCECGINVTIWPDRVFYSKVTNEDLPAIVEQICNEGPTIDRLAGQVKPDVEEMVWMLLDSPY